jgi:tetratricopeptide (TPR) repeat protein
MAGEALHKEGIAGSIEHLNAAVALDPNGISPRLALGQAYLDQGNFHLALATVKEALALDPGHVEALDLKNRTLEAEKLWNVQDGKRLRRLQEQAQRATAARWKKWIFLPTGAVFALALVIFLGLTKSPIAPSPPPPSPMVSATEVRGILAPAFPLVRVEEIQGEVWVSGELATYKDLAQLRERLAGIPGIKFGHVTVTNEFCFRYRVRPGDSLSSLAVKFYGQRSKWTAILEANRVSIKNPNLLRTGELLLIPGN